MRVFLVRSRLSIAAFAASLLVLGACGSDEPRSNEAGDPTASATAAEEPEAEPAAEFTTGDLEALGTSVGDVEGLQLSTHASGPTTARQAAQGAPDVVEELESSGYLMGWVQRFDAADNVNNNPNPTPNAMGLIVLGLQISLYEDGGTNEPPPTPQEGSSPAEDDTEPVEELGEDGKVGSYSQETPWGAAPYTTFTWSKLNATFSLTAIGLSKDEPMDEPAVLEIAKDLYEAEPSGEPALDFPEPAADLPVLLEDDFSDAQSGWAPQDYGPEAFSENRDGAWFMHVDSLGLWNSSDEFGKEELASLSDVRIEFTARPAEGNEEARYGGVCRASTEANEAYGAAVGTDGSVEIRKAADPSQPLTYSADAAKGLLSPEGDRFRMECAGDDIVYIALYVNDELVADALDDDPYAPAGAGMYVEAVTETPPIPSADVLFDDLVLAGS